MMKKLQYACMLFTLWYGVTFGLALFVPAPVVASINSGFLVGGGNLTTTGAIPFQNGTTGQITQSSTFTFVTPTLALPTSGVLKFTSACSIADSSNGFVKIFNNAGTGVCTLIFGPGGGAATNPAIVPTLQVNPYFTLGDAAGTNLTTNLRIPAQKATSGQRFACLDTNGQIISSTTACVGT